jgi:hypothetical protein
MTLDIIKPKPVEEQPTLSDIDSGVLIAQGMIDGKIFDLHSCVEYVNSQVEPDISGDDVEGMFKKLSKEAKEMSSKADRLAREGKTVTEMSKEVMGEYFTFDDIKAMKVEVYGSTTEWKNAMTADEV